MTARILLVLSLAFGLSACDTGLNLSSLNPFNWFSSSDEELVVLTPEDGYDDSADRRIAVAQVTALRIEKTTSGAIVHATGLPPRQGYWDAELVAENNGEPDGGVLTYVFRIAEPRWRTPTSSPYARSVEVAEFIPNIKLERIRTIRVQGATNVLSSRR